MPGVGEKLNLVFCFLGVNVSTPRNNWDSRFKYGNVIINCRNSVTQ
jgi:hypothetical protein